MPLSQVNSRGLPVGVQEHHAEHVDEGRKDHQVRRPAVDRADQPAELHPRHDELHALVRLPTASGGSRAAAGLPVITWMHEQEQRDAAEVVPGGGGMERNRLVGDEARGCASQAEPFVKPVDGFGFDFRGVAKWQFLPFHARREITTSSPRT